MLGNDDASFDLYLRFRLIQNRHELSDRFDVLFHIGNNQGIAAAIDFDCTTARKPSLDDWKHALIAAAASRVATSAAAEAKVRCATREATGRAGCLGQRARSARVVKPNELGNQRRVVEPRVGDHFLDLGFLRQHLRSRHAKNVAVNLNAQFVRAQQGIQR